ncbi:unnamed protein product [Coregonus sp. 'balchen']|nr:unnamed protein product [Coregonus sp. 'balchen']
MYYLSQTRQTLNDFAMVGEDTKRLYPRGGNDNCPTSNAFNRGDQEIMSGYNFSVRDMRLRLNLPIGDMLKNYFKQLDDFLSREVKHLTDW